MRQLDRKQLVRGFTLIELLVTLSIIGLLLTLAVPRYFSHVERAREAALRETLFVVRDAIDKFQSDTGKYPDSLEELATKRYIRKVPIDPINDSSTLWLIVPPPPPATGNVYDIHSNADGVGLDGTAYREW